MNDLSREQIYQIFLLSNPELEACVIRNNPPSYKIFIEQLYKDIDHISARLRESRQLLYNQYEDQLTLHIVGQLQALAYFAKREVSHGGHVDIFVQHRSQTPYIWLGEAKIFSDNGYLMDGFYQLTTRYADGEYNANSGGMIIYINNKAKKQTTSIMQDWRAALECQHQTDATLQGLTATNCSKNPICFFSEHQHQDSGLKYYVRHMPFNISFNPRDGDKRPKMPKARKAKPSQSPP